MPPCVLAQDLRPQTTKTLVAKCMGASSQLLSEWAASRVVNGAGAYAVVAMLTEEIYVVVAMPQAARVENAAASMKAAIEQLPGGPQVQWVRLALASVAQTATAPQRIATLPLCLALPWQLACELPGRRRARQTPHGA